MISKQVTLLKDYLKISGLSHLLISGLGLLYIIYKWDVSPMCALKLQLDTITKQD